MLADNVTDFCYFISIFISELIQDSGKTKFKYQNFTSRDLL